MDIEIVMKTCRKEDLNVVSQSNEGDRALGFAEATHRLTGIMAGGWAENIEYLKGVEDRMVATLNRVREARGHAETMEHLKQQEI